MATERIVKYVYRIGRIPGVGVNLSAQRVRKVTDDAWSAFGRIRNLGSGQRAMRIARLIGRL